MRAKRWGAIEKHFHNRTPRSDKESYALGLAIIRNQKSQKNKIKKVTPDVIRAFQYFFSILDISCPKGQTKDNLLVCIKKKKPYSCRRNLRRVMAWRASFEAKKYKMFSLSLALIALASIERNDPFSEKIFQEHLKQLLASKQYIKASNFVRIKAQKSFQTPFSKFLIGRTYAYEKAKKIALHYYFKGAWAASANWLRVSIHKDVQHFYPNLFSSQRMKKRNEYNWNLLAFSDVLSKKKLADLKKIWNGKLSIQKAKKNHLRMLGMFFVKTNNSSSLRLLSGKFSDYLTAHPKILKLWVLKLIAMNKESEAWTLLRPFHHVLHTNWPLWKQYLNVMAMLGKKSDNKKQYFREMLRYLKYYPHHRSIQDTLMKFLIGPDARVPQWASLIYWNEAKMRLPRHFGSGRFFYWLERFYKQKGKQIELANIHENFYAYAPGSFYVTEIWEKNTQSRYVRNWRKVKNRGDYLRWLTKHGGRRETWNFLRSRSLRKYQDPKSLKLLAELQKTQTPKNSLLRLLFSLGDWSMGVSLFRELHGDIKTPSSRRKYLLSLVQLGRWSKALNVQVYYLRQTLWEEGISFDPFSLPATILKLLYPRPYRSLVRRYSRAYQLEESMVYALMHQESLFREGAVSSAGAMGLMQIMPKTGAWLAGMIMKKQTLDLHNPSHNIRLGAYYFSRLLKKYDKDFRWSAIAYNGGPGNLRKWKRKHYQNDFYHFLEKLPNKEARNYCRITYSNYLRYKIAYSLIRS